MLNCARYDTRPMADGGTFDVIDVVYAGENRGYDIDHWSPKSNPYFEVIEEGTGESVVDAMRATKYLDYAFSNAMKYYLGQSILKDIEKLEGDSKERVEMLTGIKEEKEKNPDHERVRKEVNDKFNKQWANDEGVQKGYYRASCRVQAPASTLYVASAAQIKSGKKEKFFLVQGTNIPGILAEMDKDLSDGPVNKMAMYLYCTNNSNNIKASIHQKLLNDENSKKVYSPTPLGRTCQKRLLNDALLEAGYITNEEHSKQELWIETQGQSYYTGQQQKYSDDNKYSDFKNAMASKFLQELITIEPKVCAKGFDLANEFAEAVCDQALESERLNPVFKD